MPVPRRKTISLKAPVCMSAKPCQTLLIEVLSRGPLIGLCRACRCPFDEDPCEEVGERLGRKLTVRPVPEDGPVQEVEQAERQLPRGHVRSYRVGGLALGQGPLDEGLRRAAQPPYLRATFT